MDGKPLPARKGDWIQTVSGRQYWPLDPQSEDIEIGDVAHALGMLCRFTGHCLRFYSVAEHSVHVSHLMFRATGGDIGLALWGLLHDGPEAYINDIARPVKRSIVGYDDIEAANWRAMVERFADTPLRCPANRGRLLKQADNAMLVAEQAALMAPAPQRWAPVDVPTEVQADAHAQLATAGKFGWCPDRARWEFLQRYEALTG